MLRDFETHWLLYGGIALAVLLIVWWMLSRSSKRTRDRSYKPDVLDEGVGPAARNQALIDAAPAAQVVMPPVMSDVLGGMGEVVARAAQTEVEQAIPVEVAPPPPPPPLPAPAPEPVVAPEPQPAPVPAPEPEPEPEPESEPEPIAEVAPEPEPAPAPAAEPAPPPSPSSAGDDLSKIKGLGPKLQALLPTLGLSTYAQIAALTEADLAALDPKLGPFAGRPARDGWVEQAQYLAAGDVAGFEARFGKV